MVESEDIEGINDFKLISWELYIDKESYAILMENVSVSYYNGDIKVNMNLNTEYDYDNVTITLPPSVRNAIDKEDFYSSILCSGFDSTNNIIRWKTLEVVSNNPGQYSMNQLCDLYDFVNNNITYVPNSGDFYPQSVEQTLSAESGNCVDQSLLLASMIESLGGWTRLVVNDACDHAYVEVYIANNDEDVNTTTDFILDRYSDKDQIVRWHNDDDGTKWLILDPAGGKYPGDLYPDCYSEIDEDSWEDIGGTENLEFIYSCVD